MEEKLDYRLTYLTETIEDMKREMVRIRMILSNSRKTHYSNQEVIDLLVQYYETGNLHTFDQYTIAWVQNTEPLVDFVNGFTDFYPDEIRGDCTADGCHPNDLGYHYMAEAFAKIIKKLL